MIITTVTTDGGALLSIGRQGEHDARKIWFDLSWLIENFGYGVAVLVHQRSKDGAPYIVNATQEDERLVWNIDATDTAYDGFGQAEIRWTVGNTLAKTVIYKTSVLKSLAPETDVPDPYQSWFDALVERIGDSQEYAEQAAQSAQEAAESAEALSGMTVTVGATDKGSGIVEISATVDRG